MRVYSSLEELQPKLQRSVVAVGKFDAIHVGHARILSRLKAIAIEKTLESVVLTFSNNPRSIVAPESCPDSLLSSAQKLELIEEYGIDETLNIPFDLEFASIEPDAFVTDILIGKLAAAHVLIGHDFRYGRRGAGTASTLEQAGKTLGFRVDVIDDVTAAEALDTGSLDTGSLDTGPLGVDRLAVEAPAADAAQPRVSATMIRAVLSEGDVQSAALLLGRNHSIRGEVVHGAKRGRELGFPTANLSFDSEGMVPSDGVYAGWMLTEGEKLPVAISVGTNPTFDDVLRRQVEAFVLDRTIDLYGRTVTVEFVDRIRGMVAFESLPALIDQMTDDVDATRRLLGL